MGVRRYALFAVSIVSNYAYDPPNDASSKSRNCKRLFEKKRFFHSSAFHSSVERVYSVRYLAKSSVRRVIISDMAALCLDIIYAPCSNKFIIDRWFFHANPRRPFAARVQT